MGSARNEDAIVVTMAPLSQIVGGPNVRADVGDLEGLTESIRAHGVLQPVRVRPLPGKGPRRYALLWGQRRTAAARAAGLTEIPAMVDQAERSAAGLAIEQLVENLQRRDLQPLEEALALRQVLEADPELTQGDLAQQLGRSRPWLTNTLRLLEAPEAVRAALHVGEISAAHARALVGLDDEAVDECLQAVVERGESSKATEQRAEALRRSAPDRAARRAQAQERGAEILERLAALGATATSLLMYWGPASSPARAAVAARYTLQAARPEGPWSVLWDAPKDRPHCCDAWEIIDSSADVRAICCSLVHHADRSAAETQRRAERSKADQARREQAEIAARDLLTMRREAADRADPATLRRALVWLVIAGASWTEWSREVQASLSGLDAAAANSRERLAAAAKALRDVHGEALEDLVRLVVGHCDYDHLDTLLGLDDEVDDGGLVTRQDEGADDLAEDEE